MKQILVTYDYKELLKELLGDILDPFQKNIAYGKYIQVLREKDTKGIYKAMVDYYLLDEDIKYSIDDELIYKRYLEDKENLKIMLVDDIVEEMQEMMKGKYIDIE